MASWHTRAGSQPISSPNGAARITVPQPLESGFFGCSRVPSRSASGPVSADRQAWPGARRA